MSLSNMENADGLPAEFEFRGNMYFWFHTGNHVTLSVDDRASTLAIMRIIENEKVSSWASAAGMAYREPMPIDDARRAVIDELIEAGIIDPLEYVVATLRQK